MSLILDALRKSEAERRRGQAPDLFAAVSVATPMPAARWRRLWPLPVALLLSALGAAWLLGNREAPAAADEATAPALLAEPGVDPPAGPAREGPPSPTPDTFPAPPATALVSAPPVAATVRPPAPAPAPAPLPAAPSPPAPMPTRLASGPLPSTPVPSGKPQAGVIEAAPGDRSTAVAVAEPADEPADEPVSPIAILAASERASLPPLKLSMHVWGKDPGRRFAIVDGSRVSEGSLIGQAVVEQIRPEGVVLNVNGRRVLLPRP